MSRTRVDIQKDVTIYRGGLENDELNLNDPIWADSKYDYRYQEMLIKRAESASKLSEFEQELAKAKARGERGRTPAEIREEILDLQSKVDNYRSIQNRADRNSMQWAFSKSGAQLLQCNINALQRELSEAVEEEKIYKERERQEQYERLVQEMNQASTEKEYQKLTQEFRAMNSYKDTVTRADKCDTQYRILKEQREERERPERYEQLVQEMDKASTEEEYHKLAQKFRALNGYKDVIALADKCDTQYRTLKGQREERERQEQYERLVQEMDKASTEKEYQELIQKFRAMNGYENTTELASECDSQYRGLKERREEEERIEKQRREEQERIEKQRREEEEARKTKIKRIQKITAIAVVIAAIGILVGFAVYNSQEKSVIIPDGVTIIGKKEFAHKRLINVEIPDSVTAIGEDAFRKNKLSSIEIPASVITIGDNAFANNYLTSITIGANVILGSNTIGSNFETYYFQNGLSAGTYRRTEPKSLEWNVWYYNFRYQYNNGDIIIIGYNGSGGDIVIPEEISGYPVKIIRKRAFYEKNFTSVIIPDSVTIIEEMAFFGVWDNVKSVPLGTISSVTIGKSVTTIEDRVFENNSLSSIIIPNSVTSIGYSAFADNPITSIRLGANVKLGSNDSNGILGKNTGFNTAYANNNSRAGTYTRPNTKSTTWTRR